MTELDETCASIMKGHPSDERKFLREHQVGYNAESLCDYIQLVITIIAPNNLTDDVNHHAKVKFINDFSDLLFIRYGSITVIFGCGLYLGTKQIQTWNDFLTGPEKAIDYGIAQSNTIATIKTTEFATTISDLLDAFNRDIVEVCDKPAEAERHLKKIRMIVGSRPIKLVSDPEVGVRFSQT